MYQFGHVSLGCKYSDIEIPDELNELQKKLSVYIDNHDVTFVTNRNFMYNIVREIKYYIDSGLIDDEDIRLIKADLKSFIYKFFSFSSTSFANDRIYEVYISSFNIENGISHIAYDDKVLSIIWTYADSGMYTSDPALCRLQKEWLDSLKKFSISISGSNQKMQAELYNQFLNQLEMLIPGE